MCRNWGACLKKACIKTLTHTDLVQRKGFNGVKELQALFGAEQRVVTTLFSLSQSANSVNGMLKWQTCESKGEQRDFFQLKLSANPVLAQAQPGDNIIIGQDISGTMRCIIFKAEQSDFQGKMTNWTRYC